MVLGMVSMASAVTITIERDSTYNSDATTWLLRLLSWMSPQRMTKPRLALRALIRTPPIWTMRLLNCPPRLLTIKVLSCPPPAASVPRSSTWPVSCSSSALLPSSLLAARLNRTNTTNHGWVSHTPSPYRLPLARGFHHILHIGVQYGIVSKEKESRFAKIIRIGSNAGRGYRTRPRGIGGSFFRTENQRRKKVRP